jgi:hypothetical protein
MSVLTFLPVRRGRTAVFLLVLTMGLFASTFANSGDYSIGVYYFPGWSPGNAGATLPDPWLPIRNFPEREPLLGWYNDGQVQTIEQQLEWMHQYAIGFVAFDWYWRDGRAAPEPSIRAYLRAPGRGKVKYALLWANHFQQANADKEWKRMVAYWLQFHLKNPEYLRIDDSPVVFVFSGDFLRDNAARAGTTATQLIAEAQASARAAGVNGIHFVLGTAALEYWVRGFAPDAGFSALSAYNYHGGFAGTPASATPMSHTFRELDAGYRTQWQWILENSRLPYFLPMTNGWDKRPWGGTREDALHDESVATPEEFEVHLRAAKAMMDRYPVKTRRTGIICCWNEFGEGSAIEPSKRAGFGYLERVRKVFGGAE